MVSRIPVLLAIAAVIWGCAGLIPVELQYVVDMDPILPEGRMDFYVDADDSSVVFSKEGVLIAVRHVTDEELNREFPPLLDGRHVNPYTYEAVDPSKAYTPPRFTVFDVTVTNRTYAKVEFDPAKAVLNTDNGDEFRYYDAGREGANPLGGNSFSKYYKSELGRSGYELQLNLERTGVINESVYHRHRPVFRGDQRRGKLVFDPLPEDTYEIRLNVKEFVLSFDTSGNPEETIDIEYRFAVKQGVVELTSAQAR